MKVTKGAALSARVGRVTGIAKQVHILALGLEVAAAFLALTLRGVLAWGSASSTVSDCRWPSWTDECEVVERMAQLLNRKRS